MTQTPTSINRLQETANELAGRFRLPQDSDLLALPRDAETLLAEFEECLAQGFQEEAREVLLAESWSDEIYDLFHLIYLRHNDRRLENSKQIQGLKVCRVDIATTRARFEAGAVRMHDIGTSFNVTENGTPYLVPSDAAERVVATVVGDLQLFIPASDADKLEFDCAKKDVIGDVRESLEAGKLKRIMWGAGSCAFTEERLLGLVFDDPSDAKPPLPDELRTMPRAKFTGQDLAPIVGSLLSFTADRHLFTRSEKPDVPFFGRRLAFCQLVGDMPIAASFHAYRVVDSRNKLARPGRDVVARIVDDFTA